MAILTNGILTSANFGYANPFLYKLGGYWKFEDNFLDSSGNGLDGTEVGTVPFVSGIVGKGVSFTSFSNYISVPDSPLIDGDGNNITVSHWVKYDDFDASASLSRQGASSNGWEFYMTSSILNILFGGANIQYTHSFNTGEWYHIAFTYDNSVCRLYVNGVEVDNEVSASENVSDTQTMYIGRERRVNRDFDGDVDEVAIWNRVLSADEMAKVYAYGKYYKLHLI